ncbi:MAG: hypothetical protein OEY29_07325 [Gammaproteobacteria bacterium]|nr:hypothetical protein [Gammaproteobacteria bacterium]
MSRHKLVVAVMVPFLGIGGYIAAGYYADGKPPPMRTLVLQDECRLVAADCLLKSADLELRLSAGQKPEAGRTVKIEMHSTAKLDDALISFAGKKQNSIPHRLQEKQPNMWQGKVLIESNVDEKQVNMRLIVSWKGNMYFADENIK